MKFALYRLFVRKLNNQDIIRNSTRTVQDGIFVKGRSIENGILARLISCSPPISYSYVGYHISCFSRPAITTPSSPPSQPFPSSSYSLVSHLSYFGPREQCVQTCARPVHLDRLFRCRTQNSNMPTAEINQSNAFTRSTQTAFFIRCTPASPSARSLMYILPNRPKSAIHRMKRIVSQTQANGMRDVKGMR